jgi:hypothetical protein
MAALTAQGRLLDISMAHHLNHSKTLLMLNLKKLSTLLRSTFADLVDVPIKR